MSDTDPTPEPPEGTGQPADSAPEPPAAPEAPSAPATPPPPAASSAPTTNVGGLKLTTGQIVLLAASAVIFIVSFFPWIHESLSGGGSDLIGASKSFNGWHHMGGLIAILAIALLVLAVVVAMNVLPVEKSVGDLIVAALGALTLVLGVINLIIWLTDSHLGSQKSFGVSIDVSLSFGFYLGVVGLIGLGYGLFELVRSGDVLNTAKGLQAK